MPETVGERLAKESGDPEQIKAALEEAKRAGADEAHVDAALAELKKQETDPDAILELCQKAEAFKKKGNERLKEPDLGPKMGAEDAPSAIMDNTKSGAREALELFTSGLEVRCSDPVLNAQLYSNRAHVRLLLRQFLLEVDDCRKAIERDPKNIKAYWRAARASLQLDLCRNGIDFCEAGLEQAPGDADLQKLRAACAEKLAGQQQRRRAQEAAANRDFNADEAMAVQDKACGMRRRLKSTLSSKQRQRVRLELTQQTIESTPEDAKLYRGIGRCFLLCVVPLIVASPALQALVRAGIAGTGIAGSICGPGAAKDAESQPRAGEAQRRRREGASGDDCSLPAAGRPLGCHGCLRLDILQDGLLDEKDLKKYALSEFKFTLPEPAVKKIFKLLVTPGTKGISKDNFQRAKVQIGIVREYQIDLERKKRREEREKELEVMKEKLKGQIEDGAIKERLCEALGEEAVVAIVDDQEDAEKLKTPTMKSAELITKLDELMSQAAEYREKIAELLKSIKSLKESEKEVIHWLNGQLKPSEQKLKQMDASAAKISQAAKGQRAEADQKQKQELQELQRRALKIIEEYQKAGRAAAFARTPSLLTRPHSRVMTLSLRRVVALAIVALGVSSLSAAISFVAMGGRRTSKSRMQMQATRNNDKRSLDAQG
eukprot:g8814.t1